MLYQLQIDNNLSGIMMRLVDPLQISFSKYRVIFGDSDEEGTKDIDFLGIDEDDEESDEVNSESGNEGASDSDSEEEEEEE